MFGELLFGAADIALYADEGRQEEVTDDTLMQTSTMKGVEEAPPIVVFYGRLVVGSGSMGPKKIRLTARLQALSEATISNSVLTISEDYFPYPRV